MVPTMYYDMMIANGFSYQDCVDAGYFEDEYQSKHQLMEMLCDPDSPFNDVIVDAIVEKSPDIIISMAGCFSPMHAGHLDAIRLARSFYIDRGYNPLCVLFPAHDSYVDVKRGGTCKFSAMSRIQYMKKFLEDNNETDIIIDEHPALYMPAELNFPYLMMRLSHFAPNVKQSFVVGADNQMFALAIKQTEHDTFIVSRDSVDITVDSRLQQHGMSNDNIFVVKNSPYSYLSSTLIRDKVMSSLSNPDISGTYMVRDDSGLGGFENVTERLVGALDFVFEGKLDITVIDAKEQVEMCRQHVANMNSYVISMDKYFQGDFNIRCSRLFKKNTYQKSPCGFLVENEDEFIQFLKQLPKNANVLIVDDDISSGHSFNYVRNLIFRNTGVVAEGFFMNLFYLQQKGINKKVYDIIDVRDFVPFAKNGGLRTKHNRLMYKYPQVNLATRAKIPHDKIMLFNELMYG